MEIIFENVVYKDFNLDFTINNNDLTGITGRGKSTILRLIAGNKSCEGKITYDNLKLSKQTATEIRNKISIVSSQFAKQVFLNTVRDHMEFIIKSYRLLIKNPEKKMIDSLKIVGLDASYLEKNITILSKSELKLIQIAISLLSNPEIILLDEPFIDLDNKNEKKIYMLLIKLKEQYQKTIVIASIDSNMLYKYTTKMIFIKNNKVLTSGNTNEIYTRVDFLTRNKFEVPDIVMFTYKAKREKKIKLDYHRDIRDIIKDIYKHV